MAARTAAVSRFLDCVKLMKYKVSGQNRSLCTGYQYYPSDTNLKLERLNTAPLDYDATSYEAAMRESIESPETFWGAIGQKIDWFKPYTKVLDHSNPPFTQWFTDGWTNACHNAVDRHVSAGFGNNLALIHDSPVTNSKKWITYSQLLEQVELLAGALRERGVRKGERVLIYMPMIPETVVSILAASRLGSPHIVVFGGFSAKELAVRMEHSRPRVVLTASAGIEPKRVVEYKPLVDAAIDLCPHKPEHVIVYERKSVKLDIPMTPKRDVFWTDALGAAKPERNCTPVPSSHPLYILHTSGTTGTPKGVVRPTGAHLAFLPWSMRCVYNIRPGENWWAASDFGWVVGHSYIAYAPLTAGVASLIYEGKPVGTPDTSQYFRMVEEHKLVSFFVAPTALRAIRQVDKEALGSKGYEMPLLRAVHCAGEHLDWETREWAESAFRKPVYDHWWQTETGGPITAVCTGYDDCDTDSPKDSAGKAVPGWNLHIFGEDGQPRGLNKMGRIVAKLPLLPGFASTMWQADDKFKQLYFDVFPGYYDSMDAGYMDSKGWLVIGGRVDDVINVAGHRLSTTALEEGVLECGLVADCAVVGVPDELKGARPLALVVLSDTAGAGDVDHSRVQDCVRVAVRTSVGPVADLKTIVIVPKLPKTRSGKIARQTLAAMAAGKTFKIPSTIEDADVYDEIRMGMMAAGVKLAEGSVATTL